MCVWCCKVFWTNAGWCKTCTFVLQPLLSTSYNVFPLSSHLFFFSCLSQTRIQSRPSWSAATAIVFFARDWAVHSALPLCSALLPAINLQIVIKVLLSISPADCCVLWQPLTRGRSRKEQHFTPQLFRPRFVSPLHCRPGMCAPFNIYTGPCVGVIHMAARSAAGDVLQSWRTESKYSDFVNGCWVSSVNVKKKKRFALRRLCNVQCSGFKCQQSQQRVESVSDLSAHTRPLCTLPDLNFAGPPSITSKACVNAHTWASRSWNDPSGKLQIPIFKIFLFAR